MTGAVDWATARRVALRGSSRKAPPTGTGSFRTLAADMAELTPQAEALVTAQTGLVSEAGPARARVVNRAMWIDANISSFQRLLGPLVDKLAHTGGSSRLAGIGSRFAGTEVGVVLGWMSTRVLGQYDLLITEDDRPEDQDIVYYVGPNLMALEARHDFDPRQFRLWLALHEVTHRAQFTGVPWMREHFLGLVNQTIDAVDPDPKRLLESAKEIIEARREGRDVLADGGIATLLASPEQRVVLDKVTGLMSLLEGHGDITMDRAGADLIPSAGRFARVLRERRNSARGVSKLFQRLIGIEAKMNQYVAGEAFIEAVEAVGGSELVDRAWESSDNLPTMPEIRDPQSWVDRISSAPVLAAS
ncbi:MAG: zinc-dependent metalloprotease [Acidimicrobiia bacterium]|nr:zinc-dependent metalloprotease [Acidimicrobiia bacterium]